MGSGETGVAEPKAIAFSARLHRPVTVSVSKAAHADVACPTEHLRLGITDAIRAGAGNLKVRTVWEAIRGEMTCPGMAFAINSHTPGST